VTALAWEGENFGSPFFLGMELVSTGMKSLREREILLELMMEIC